MSLGTPISLAGLSLLETKSGCIRNIYIRHLKFKEGMSKIQACNLIRMDSLANQTGQCWIVVSHEQLFIRERANHSSHFQSNSYTIAEFRCGSICKGRKTLARVSRDMTIADPCC